MIKIENAEVLGWEHVIRGMRNPMNSWAKSDTTFYDNGEYHDIFGNSEPANALDDYNMVMGANDFNLMIRLAKAGTDHAKFRRMITVYVDLTAPLYWWKEFDTHKVGTVANSCSTMHKIHEKEFTLDDFSHEHLYPEEDCCYSTKAKKLLSPIDVLSITIECLNHYRDLYLSMDREDRDKNDWWQIIQLLPSSYNQKRTVMLNYEVLANIYKSRKDHKLDEWREFCKWIEALPYSEIITGKETEKC